MSVYTPAPRRCGRDAPGDCRSRDVRLPRDGGCRSALGRFARRGAGRPAARTLRGGVEDDIVTHFKYGSVGTEGTVGLPYPIWRVLPVLFADKLPKRPGEGWETTRLHLRERLAAAPSDRHQLRGRIAFRWWDSTARPAIPGPFVSRRRARGRSFRACRRIRWTCKGTRTS